MSLTSQSPSPVQLPRKTLHATPAASQMSQRVAPCLRLKSSHQSRSAIMPARRFVTRALPVQPWNSSLPASQPSLWTIAARRKTRMLQTQIPTQTSRRSRPRAPRTAVLQALLRARQAAALANAMASLVVAHASSSIVAALDVATLMLATAPRSLRTSTVYAQPDDKVLLSAR